jgi:hypothetical protein
MPPKKDTAAASGEDANAIVGFTAKETKLLAAAFVASVGTGKVCLCCCYIFLHPLPTPLKPTPHMSSTSSFHAKPTCFPTPPIQHA